MTACKDCTHWNDRSGRGMVGRCRRYAPRCICGVGTGESDVMFAETNSDDWCGEFAPIKPAPAPQFDAVKVRELLKILTDSAYTIGQYYPDAVKQSSAGVARVYRDAASEELCRLLGIED